jgi:hypothetical protein
MRSKGGDPLAPRATIHALKEGDPHDPREAIHAVLHTIQGRRSMRSEGGDPCDPREVSTSSEGVDHNVKGRKVTTRFRGDHSRAPREAIHEIKGGHPHAQGRPFTHSREAIHTFQGS